MVKPTARPLKAKRKASLIEVNTPPSDFAPSANLSDFESSYLSICCLLQTESEASVKLVTESHILSQMLERMRNGTPRHIEEHTLGAVWSALTWVPVEVVRGLIEQGLFSVCYVIVIRSSNQTNLSRKEDRLSEIALEILRDLCQLDDSVTSLLLESIDSFVGIMVSLPTTFPSVVIKRAMSRLIHTVVESRPQAFVAGLPESRLSIESMRNMFSLCGCEDLETSCYLTLSGLVLEQAYGSSVCPTVSNIRTDFIEEARLLVEEACLLSGEGTDEEALRLSQWRSRVRGISTLIEHVAEVIEDRVSEGIERVDNIEDRKFFMQKGNGNSRIEFLLVPKLLQVDRFTDSASRLISACRLEDRDLENMFQLLGFFVRIKKLVSFRFGQEFDNSSALFALRLLHDVSIKEADVGLLSLAVFESLDLVSTLLLSIASGKNRQPCGLLESLNLCEFLSSVLKKIRKESQDLEDISCCIFEIVQLVAALTTDPACRRAAAELLLEALADFNDKNMKESVVSTFVEAVFAVFGESDTDYILFSADWVGGLSNIAVFLNATSKTLKTAKTERTQYLEGTIENIKAFVNYKRAQSVVS